MCQLTTSGGSGSSSTTTCPGAFTVDGNFTASGSFTFGDAVADNWIVKGRIASSTAAGAALDIISTYSYTEGVELRYSVSDWTGVGTSFSAAYIRAQTGAASASKEIIGATIYGVSENHNLGSLKGILGYAYIKGVTAATVGPAYGGHFELSFDAGASTKTITTEASAGLLKITGGVVDTYTKLHGLIIRAGDMDGASRTYGNGILIEDDSAMAGTITWTKGLSITAPCTTAISVSGTVNTGLDFSSITAGTNTDGSILKVGTLSVPLALNTADQFGVKTFFSSTATTGTLTAARIRAMGNAASGTPGVIGVLAQGSTIASKVAGEVVGIRAEAIAKASSTVSTNHFAVYAKVEDELGTSGAGGAATYSGDVASIAVFGQIAANPTGVYAGIFFDAHSSAGTGSQNWDAALYFKSEGQTDTTVSFLKTGATIATLGSSSATFISSGNLTDSGAASVACDARIKCDIGGTPYWIPLFDTAV